MVKQKSEQDYGFEEILNQAPRKLHGYEDGSKYSIDDIDETRYVIFPHKNSLDELEGIGVLTSQEIRSFLDGNKKYPVLRTLDMSIERINKENREGGRLLVAKVEDNELYNMGYLIKDREILGAWPYKEKRKI
ncbi:MAG: hypothetical protein ABEI78_00810 [Candidatus Nanohaloarchaea archaeon]